MNRILVTGSSGLIGSEVCLSFAGEGWEVHGIDNNQRSVFFGPEGDSRWNQRRLERMIKGLSIMSWIFVTAREYWTY
jgi:CDP-paratose 2-epimerase